MNKCSRFLDVPHVPPLLVPSSDHGDFGDFRLSKPGFWLSLWARNVAKTQKTLWARANTWHWAHHTPLLGLQNTSGSNAAKCMSRITKHTIVNFRKRRICAAHNHIEFVIAWIIVWIITFQLVQFDWYPDVFNVQSNSISFMFCLMLFHIFWCFLCLGDEIPKMPRSPRQPETPRMPHHPRHLRNAETIRNVSRSTMLENLGVTPAWIKYLEKHTVKQMNK